MSKCVNIKSQEFKDCCSRLNVSTASLEPIIHEYINIEGNEESFPSDDYIERVIHGSEQLVLSDKQVIIWEREYSQPAQFDHVLEAMSYISEVERFFPRESIGIKETLDGKVEVTVARPYVETELTKKGIIQKFRKSLFRGQGGKPKIDENGNLVIEATYDSLFRNYGKSFATSVEEAYYYGERSSRNPYIIELDLDYLDTIIPLDENARTNAVGVRAIGDEYGGDAREERLQFEGKILIPKGKYKISRKKGEFDNLSSAELLDTYINYFNIWNSADELAYGEGYSRLTNGIVSGSDIKDIYDELVNRLGKEEADNFIKFYGEFNNLRFDEFEYSSSFNPNDFLGFNEEAESEFITNSFYKRVKLAEEKQQIKQKAIADGTFMLAPNGKPTNLTEDQWLSVRTKAFKDWFGDWLNNPFAENVTIDDGSFNPDNVDGLGYRPEFIFRQNGEYIGSFHFEEYIIGKEGIVENNTPYLTFPDVGQALSIESEFRGRGLGKAMYYEAAKFAARKGKTLRSASLGSISESAKRVWDSFVKSGYATLEDNHYIFNNDKLNFSKVVDENGEPLQVYHHTDNPNLTEFSTEFDNYFAKDGGTKEAIFFDENETGTLGRKYDIPVFLNIRELNEYNETKQQLHDRGTTYREIVNQSAERNNKYGGVHMKDFDDNKMEHQSIWIVHNPNQIKSADFNIGYSKEDDNIYHENEATNYTATRDVRLETLREQEEVSIVDLLNLIDSNSEYTSIINLLKTKKQRGKTPLLKGIKVKIVNSAITPESYDVKKLETSRGQYRRAYYDASSKTIIINSNGLFNGGRADSVILHEVIHAITVNRIKDNKEFRAEFDSIIEKYLEAFPHLKYRYGKDNNSHYMEEFIADIWSNTQTIEHLKSIKSDKKLTLWDKIRNFFVKLFAGSDGTLMGDASDALYRLLDELETDTSKDTFYEGELISSSARASKFARQLTNPGNNLTVEYRGTTFRNAEHAYQTWKSGEFDDTAYKSTAFKPVGSKKVNKAVNFDIMVEIITAKLQQHPELIQGITDRGGLDYIRNSTHVVTGDKYWESSGENKFIEALAEAYKQVSTLTSDSTAQQDFTEINTETQEEINEEDLTQEEIDARSKKQEEIEALLQNTVKLSKQVEAIQKSGLFTTSEFTELAIDVAYYMSDLITQWQENPEKFKEAAPTLAEKIDVQTISRKDLVQAIGVPKFLKIVKEALFNSIENEELWDKADVLMENFDALVRFGSNAFGSVEDFQLQYSDAGYSVKDAKEDIESDNGALSNEEESITEECGDKQEHWQIDSRTIDNFLSMSQAVKRELARCYKINPDGSIEVNDFEINKRMDPREATQCILRWTQGALTLEDMISKLEVKAENNPWINSIITKLKDRTGKYADFQSQFFGVFCKHFQEYYIVKEFKADDGSKVFRIMPANINPALQEVVTGIDVMYKMQQHPMFNSSGIIADKLSTFESYVNTLKKLISVPYESWEMDRIIKGLSLISTALGFEVTEEFVSLADLSESNVRKMAKALGYIVSNLKAGAKKSTYDPFSYKKDSNGIRNNLKEFLQPLTDVLEDTRQSSTYDSGKMYQSYIIPSFLTKLMNKFHIENQDEFHQFMENEYGQYEWFRDTTLDIESQSSWKNSWLRDLWGMSAEARKEMFRHKVQLSFNGHNYMRNMSGPEYVLSILTEYFSKDTDTKNVGTAWYKVPMMSNKPSLEFIKFIRHRGETYQTTILAGFMNIFAQELGRIITVKDRAYNKKDSRFIKNFDANGKKFQFLSFLNQFLDNTSTPLGKLLDKKINSKEELSPEEEIELASLVEKEIADFMSDKCDEIIEGYKQSGLFEAAKKIDGIGKTDEEVESNLREFIWNDAFASMNIMQITITDMAYYANAEDLQKRLAQIHAPGIRGNIYATDYEGNRVCDGSLRTIFLEDYEGDAVIQNIIENLEIVFQKKIDAAKTPAEKAYWETTIKSIIDAFRGINVADAQAYNCPTSYRKKALMFGKWNKKFEETYQKLKEGEYNATDLEAAFQPLKPFVYTQTTKEDGFGGKLKVGMQFKNSEYLLIMADAILQGEDTGKPNLLRAIFEVMEDSAKKDPTKGIDTFQFASAVKAGLHGKIDIASFKDTKEAKKYIEEKIYGGTTNIDGYNDTFVHTYPAEDYTIQQEVPAHFLDHHQAHGSQERYIIPSDLESKLDKDGNETIFYEFDDPVLEHRKLTAKEYKKEYEEIIAKNIEESIEELKLELGLNNTDRKLRNIALSEILKAEILSSPRYGMDLYFACSLDENGEFNIPLGDPIQAKRIEQLINSIVKNRVNKQKIAGGPVVQVSNFGMSRRLNIRFKDKQGNILPALTEWLDKNPGKTAEDFKQEIKEKQAGIAYYECYAPAYMQEMLEDFMDEKGNIDIEALEEIEPELLDMIGYRIPTEDKYSIAPLKIVGFLPKEGGEGIVLPYEITVITGSDRIVVSTSII